MFTTWIERPNSRLNDYAHHQLAGLLSGYYAQRWKIFFTDSENAEAKLDEIERNAPFADWKTPPKNGNLLEIAEAEFCGDHSKINAQAACCAVGGKANGWDGISSVP